MSPPRPPLDFAAWLKEQGIDAAQVNLPDLQLAFEARRNDVKAIAELDRRIRAVCEGLSRKKGLVIADVDELAQRVRERVLVGGKNSGARIAAYQGKGALVKWLQAVAASVAIDSDREVKARREDDDDDELLVMAAAEESAEARLLKARGKKSFSEAFKVALAELPTRDRTVMRLRYVDQANLDDIAKMFNVHRTSVMRWLEAAHAQVLGRTRGLLIEKLKLSDQDIDSLIRELELSFSDRVSRLFATKAH